ncbi:MAG: serine/threonine-protein phosphatase [Planctomycetota bacterium]|nr:serine/threonine-protein phosphatase [Planctomycetota bacterium]
MYEAKNTARALVRIGYDGRVHKFFRATDARQRFENEIRVLRYLESRGCDFVPRVLATNEETLELVMSSCGARVEQMGEARIQELFAELEAFGVRHDDPFLRNVTYRAADGRFCIIDFEFATILDEHVADLAFRGENLTTTDRSKGLRWSGATDVGPIRPNNEDAFLAITFDDREFHYLTRTGEIHDSAMDFVFAVSDGMGGEKSGEFASRFAIDHITRLLPRRFASSPGSYKACLAEIFAELYQGIHRQLTVLGESYAEGQNMGATLSLIWYVRGWLHFAHIGDSRIYHVHNQGPTQQISEDDTHVGFLRRAGKLNEREARTHPRRNVLSQSLGAGNLFIRPQIGSFSCHPGDRLVLCTDGVTDGLWDHAFEDCIREDWFNDQNVPLGQRIVRRAIEGGSRDNATALAVELL